ncbi:sodium:solute symporter family protein [Pseudodesulfovibrio sp.]|uniref:sodium:solute symporter family protein n=1 Tax=Pseudodesulfovibrio sp. TaxID=2035812 RepID=UPI00261275DA|nr:sodium:solute symporter family protein [Pseudodesulfovibrio sp.]MDD3311225.1 sodium:solute symporter family protein [Pseudodesulfovibrio sp.]
MEAIDYTVLVLYFCSLLAIAVHANRKQKTTEDYYVGGRGVGTLSLAALWMSSWVGGAAIMGTAEKSYQIGISSLWYPFSMFSGFIFFALIFAGRIKELGDKHRHITYSDLIEQRYDTRVRLVSTITTILAYIGYTASQLLSAAQIITSITGVGLGVSFLVATSVTVVYTSIGGFFAVEKTDRFQTLLVIIGVSGVAVPLTWHSLGDVSRLSTELPTGFFNFGAWGWGAILAMFISMVLTFFTSMDSYTRCYAARTARAARNGTLLAALIVLCISVSICFLGMSARLIIPAGEDGTSTLIRLIIHIFPVGVKGLMLVAILSAIMSTADTCILCASANLTRDIYQRFINPGAHQAKVMRLSIASSILVGVIGALVGWYSKSIINLLIMAFTINSAGLFLPTMGVLFWRRASSTAAFWSISVALVTVIGWYLARSAFPESALFSIDPVWPGLLASALFFFSPSFAPRRAREAE